ncbi:MAG: Holliday junction resolvase RuvX [Chloroflexota bacterium]
MRILAVDPGTKHIGLAISDPAGSIANPLLIVKHTVRQEDALAVLEQVKKYHVELIVVGQSLDDSGNPTYEGRRSSRFAKELQRLSDIKVVLVDEGFSTIQARQARIDMNVRRKKRSGHMDDLAATIILQAYLDIRSENLGNHDRDPR